MAPSATNVIETTPAHLGVQALFNKDVYFDSETHGVNQATNTARKLIRDALQNRVEGINHENCEPGDEDTFYVADLGEVYRQHMRWKKNLPRVRPFYGEYTPCPCLS